MVSAIGLTSYEIASVLGPIVVGSITGIIENRRHNGELVLDGNVRTPQVPDDQQESYDAESILSDLLPSRERPMIQVDENGRPVREQIIINEQDFPYTADIEVSQQELEEFQRLISGNAPIEQEEQEMTEQEYEERMQRIRDVLDMYPAIQPRQEEEEQPNQPGGQPDNDPNPGGNGGGGSGGNNNDPENARYIIDVVQKAGEVIVPYLVDKYNKENEQKAKEEAKQEEIIIPEEVQPIVDPVPEIVPKRRGRKPKQGLNLDPHDIFSRTLVSKFGVNTKSLK